MLRTWQAFLLLFVMALYLKAGVAVNIDFSAASHDSRGSGDDGEDIVAPPSRTDTPDISEPTELPPARASESASKDDKSFFSYTVVPDIQLNFPTNGTVPNWVGPSIGDYADTACYRKTHKQNSQGGCPQGYHANKHRCWAQCPIAYPVQCLTECIPQNDDCILEIMAKVTNPGYVLLNIATAGVFNAIYKSFKMVKTGLMCAFNIFNIAEGISRFMRFRQIYTPNGTKEELLAAVYQTDLFLIDLPVAITACMGYPVPRYAYFADAIVTAAETFVKQLMINHNLIMSSVDSFMRFFKNSTLGNSTRNLDAETATNLTTMLDSGSRCGFELKRLTDRVIIKVGDIREANPSATNEDIRTEMSQSSIVLNDVPTVTNNCMRDLLKTKKPYAAYQTRDILRKTFGVIIDQLIDKSTTDLGKAKAKEEYWLSTANLGLLGLSAMDPSGIAFTMYNYVQPVCGPTEFIGEIDDGSATDALGLSTVDDAFRGSKGTWTKKGDGKVVLTLASTDTKDVDVIIHSGGKKFASVKVCSGQTIIWTSTVKELQEKTMYLDRWRPGFLGLPGSGGGSLLLWVPRSSEGGHLEMTVKINKS
ncbi:hypothetical protein PPTG_13779 [Phytophthora nicotianae INRA-310]|uniref:Jacalin-type lectin domain-containing protein n=2 Tax=Phytophthora nicotianae TaxID=4792 RepID=W2PZT4_PHYN3|nr:hypothetical protein PPTG_13779 [Phytophthora nicotianae INRA-310]ETN06458.1 hypothetical protein PPTG_13779 [Phytophthora nicotianae INRA-310]KUF89397.1 hypothetical protein AM587_10004995 [Phytophthora nicotianae]